MNRSRTESKLVRLFYMVIFSIIVIIVFMFIIISSRMNDQYEETMAYAIENVTYRSVLEVRSYFEPIILVDKLLTDLWDSDDSFESQALRIEYYARRMVKLYPQITNIYFGNESGDFVLYHKNEMGSGSVDTKLSIRNSDTTTIRRYDDNLLVQVERHPLEAYDPRERPWYIGSKTQEVLYLTDPYVFYTSQKLGTSVARRLDDSNGFWGSYGIDIILDDLKDMLNEINIMKNGEAFIQMPNGAIISNELIFDSMDDFSVYIDPERYGQRLFTEDGYMFVALPIADAFQSDMILGIVLDYKVFSRRLEISGLIIRAAFALLFINLLLFVSVRLMNKKSKTQLFDIATLDQLTGLRNRHTFEDFYVTLQDKFVEEGQIFSIAIADIDFFKAVNDTYGHIVGDQVLVEISHLIASELRDSDIVFRWGGEEFLILFANSDAAHAQLISDRLREKIEKHVFLRDNLDIQCTMSFGIAEHNTLMDKNTLVKNADDCLYLAKKNGRNQVQC